MKSIVEQISKEIVAAAEGAAAGIVTNVYVSDKLRRVRGYKASDEERDVATLLPLRRLLGDEDALVVRNLSALQETSLAECPLGAKIYDTTGKALGVLRDLYFDEGSGEVISLVTGEGELSPERVLSFGSRVLLLRAPEHDNTLFRKRGSGVKRSAPKVPSEKIALPKAELTLTEISAEREAVPEESDESLFHDYAFLLGRRVRKDIVGAGGIIAAENDVVTPDVVIRAHRSGKLVELTVNSRK